MMGSTCSTVIIQLLKHRCTSIGQSSLVSLVPAVLVLAIKQGFLFKCESNMNICEFNLRSEVHNNVSTVR